MAKKEISEEMMNYNRFPGEHVIVNKEQVLIGEKVFNLVYNYRDGFDAEKLEQRFSEVLTKYDYIIGDWGHEQLRLKGFYSTSRKQMTDEEKISSVQDYIDEYCNYGCAFFIIKRLRGQESKEVKDKDFRPGRGDRNSNNSRRNRKPNNKSNHQDNKKQESNVSSSQDNRKNEQQSNSSTHKKRPNRRKNPNKKVAYTEEKVYKIEEKKPHLNRKVSEKNVQISKVKKERHSFTIVQKEDKGSN